MEVGNVEGVEQGRGIGLEFHPISPHPLQLDLNHQAPLHHTSASLTPLPWAQKSSTADVKSVSCSQFRFDLNKSPSASCDSNGHDDLQTDIEVGNVFGRISHEQKEDNSMRRELKLSGEQSSHLDLFPKAPLHHASTSLMPLPGAEKSSNKKSEMFSPNSIDLSKLPPASCNSNEENKISNGQEQDNGRRNKLVLSDFQLAVLEESFKQDTTVKKEAKAALAKRLNITTRQVQVWFQNKKQRNKRKEREMVSEVEKRDYRQLIEENERLQRELAEMKDLKQAEETASAFTEELQPLKKCRKTSG